MALFNRLFPSRGQDEYGSMARHYARQYDATVEDVRLSQQARRPGLAEVRSVTWFFQGFGRPYAGILTPLRFADHFKRRKGVKNRFVVLSDKPAAEFAASISKAFPGLAGEEVSTIREIGDAKGLPPSDAAVATYWKTAYALLKFNGTGKKLYFLQDEEPLFYPAGSVSAQVEATYRFGFHGVASSKYLKGRYERVHGGRAVSFLPQPSVEPVASLAPKTLSEPYKLFFYGRPGIPRNGFELGVEAVRKLKERLGGKLRVLSVGARWDDRPHGTAGLIEQAGVLDHGPLASLYKECDAGLVMIFTPIYSYIHLDLMASGCPVVSNRNPAIDWLLKDRADCLLSPLETASTLSDTLHQALTDAPLRARLAGAALETAKRLHAGWEAEAEKVFTFLSF